MKMPQTTPPQFLLRGFYGWFYFYAVQGEAIPLLVTYWMLY